MKITSPLIFLFFVAAFNFKTSATTNKWNEIIQDQRTLLPPADLVVTDIRFISIYFDADNKTYLVKVAVTVHNAGTATSGKTKMEAHTKPSEGAGSWKVMGSAIDIPKINPGGKFNSEFFFKESILSVGTVSFDFRIKVDSRNIVPESEEHNNYSKIIVINPRAH